MEYCAKFGAPHFKEDWNKSKRKVRSLENILEKERIHELQLFCWKKRRQSVVSPSLKAFKNKLEKKHLSEMTLQ